MTTDIDKLKDALNATVKYIKDRYLNQHVKIGIDLCYYCIF